MSEAFFEKVDVFLPGQGETLAPAYHWERTEHATGHIYYSTRKPKRAFIVPIHGYITLVYQILISTFQIQNPSKSFLHFDAPPT